MTQQKRVLILLGMPGVGKGTQAQRMAEHYKLFHIDTGQSLRQEIASESDLGKEAKAYVDKGELVPFELVMKVIKAAMVRIPENKAGYLFDGFPRNLSQVDGLDAVLMELRLTLDSVLYLETPYEILMDRLAYRVTCPKCDAKYNLKLKPPKQENTCDACQSELVTRKDDRPEVIENRLKAYQEETSPLVDYYDKKSLLQRINADQAIDVVFEDIRQHVDKFFKTSDTMVV